MYVLMPLLARTVVTTPPSHPATFNRSQQILNGAFALCESRAHVCCERVKQRKSGSVCVCEREPGRMRNQNKLQKNRDFQSACVYVLTSVYLAYAHRTNKNIQNNLQATLLP